MSDEKYLAMKVNSFLIQQLYRSLGNDRNNIFQDSDEEQKPGKKISYIRIYNVLNIESSKFNRIINEDKGSGYTKEEAKALSLLFNIDMAYFQKENAVLFPIAGFDIEDWKIVFNENKSYKYKTKKTMTSHERKANSERLKANYEKAIKNICQEGVANIGNADNPLYRIVFYFVHGRAYNDDQLISKINDLIVKLNEITVSNWIAFQKKDNLQMAYEVLTKQYEIVDAKKK